LPGLIDEVKAKRQIVVITKHGQFVAKRTPVDAAADEIFGVYKGRGTVVDDVVAPLPSPGEWNSCNDSCDSWLIASDA